MVAMSRRGEPRFRASDFENKPVFILDDDRTVLERMHRVLTRAGYNTRSFTVPAEALAETWSALTEQRSYRGRMSAAGSMGTLVGVTGPWFAAESLEALQISETGPDTTG